MKVPRLSIVSPVFCAAPIIDELVGRMTGAALEVTEDFEIILVDDGSSDDSWFRIAHATEGDPRIKGLRLSRNFGQHQAITAGLACARGDWLVVMDCDLQDDPRYIPQLMQKAAEGFDVVLTYRLERRHSWIRNLTAKLFFWVFNLLTDGQAGDHRVGGYSLISRKVVDSFLRINDVHRHYLLIIRWMGFRQTLLRVEHAPRYAGKSSYSFIRLIRHTLVGITSQSTKLLTVSIGLGFAYVVAAIVGVIYLLVGYYAHGFRAGWASTIVLLLASTGLILMGIGILGIYIGNIFDQVRSRPIYLIQDSRNVSMPPQ